MTYPPPPPPGVPDKPRLRGRTGIRVGAILAIVGLVVFIVGAVVGFSNGLSKVNDFQRVALADRTGTLTFKAGSYLAYYEAPNYDPDSKVVPIIAVVLTNKATGANVSGTFYGNRSDNKVNSLTYDYNGHKGAALYQFRINTSGTYVVRLSKPASSDAASDSDVAFGKSIATGLAVGGVIALVGLLLLIAGIIVLIVGLVRRRGHKKELAAAPSYPYGAAPGYPPSGYAPQGYPPPGQQAYPPPGQQAYPPPGQQAYPPPGQQAYPPPGQQAYPPPGQQAYPPPGQQAYPPPQQQGFERPTSLEKDDPTQSDPTQNPWPPKE